MKFFLSLSIIFLFFCGIEIKNTCIDTKYIKATNYIKSNSALRKKISSWLSNKALKFTVSNNLGKAYWEAFRKDIMVYDKDFLPNKIDSLQKYDSDVFLTKTSNLNLLSIDSNSTYKLTYSKTYNNYLFARLSSHNGDIKEFGKGQFLIDKAGKSLYFLFIFDNESLKFVKMHEIIEEF
jgi:hypothetical protein